MSIKLPKFQELRQKSQRGCAVPVFARLAGVPEEEVLRDLPPAVLGLVSVGQWITWLKLKKRGFGVLKREGDPTDILPCAHLVAPGSPRSKMDFHWVFRDREGNIHDPSEVFVAFAADDPRMKDLSVYGGSVLTIALSKAKGIK
jgi:hypothetical protein